MDWGAKRRDDRESGQASLFGGGGSAAEAPPPPLPDLPDWDDATRLANEKATLGFYVSGHPLESFRELLQDFATHTTATLREAPSGGEVAVGGIVTELRKRKSKKGQWWASLQLEDLEGHVVTLVFPKTYEASQALLENGRALLVTGRVENEEGRVRLTADDVMVLDDAREKKAQAVQVRLEDGDLEEATLRRLRRALEGSPGSAPG